MAEDIGPSIVAIGDDGAVADMVRCALIGE